MEYGFSSADCQFRPVNRRTGNDDAVDWAIDQLFKVLALEFLIVVWAQNQRDAVLFHCQKLDAFDERAEERIADVRNDHADGFDRISNQISRIEVRNVAQSITRIKYFWRVSFEKRLAFPFKICETVDIETSA